MGWIFWNEIHLFSRLFHVGGEFDKVRKCPGNVIACETNSLTTKSQSINIMSVEENFNYRRKTVLLHSFDIPCLLFKKQMGGSDS